METWNRSVGMQVFLWSVFRIFLSFLINFQKQCRTQWVPIYKVGCQFIRWGWEHVDGSGGDKYFC